MKIKIISRSGRIPAYETGGAAGFDIRALLEHDFVLPAGGRALVPTGLYLEIPEGCEAQVRARSGLAIRHGIGLVKRSKPSRIPGGAEEVSVIRGYKYAET